MKPTPILFFSCVVIAGLATGLFALDRPTVASESTAVAGPMPLLVLTGRESEISKTTYRLAASQEIFDKIWTEHLGPRVETAVQGWPMPAKINFEKCCAVFVFEGDATNSNGYRVVETVDESDAHTIRIESISFQTASFDGKDSGVAVRPWAMILTPRTDKTILLEENVQNRIGGEPVWKQRIAFPGKIGVGRPVPGTRQTGADGG